MSPFGTRLGAIDRIMRDSAADRSMSGPDWTVLINRLAAALAQARIIAQCWEADAPARRATPLRPGRAA